MPTGPRRMRYSGLRAGVGLGSTGCFRWVCYRGTPCASGLVRGLAPARGWGVDFGLALLDWHLGLGLHRSCSLGPEPRGPCRAFARNYCLDHPVRTLPRQVASHGRFSGRRVRLVPGSLPVKALTGQQVQGMACLHVWARTLRESGTLKPPLRHRHVSVGVAPPYRMLGSGEHWRSFYG